LVTQMRVFQEVVGHQFNFLHCWLILRNERKWEDKLKGVKEERSRSRMPADPSASAQGTDSEAPDSAARPIGWDAAKKREAINQAQASNVEMMLDVEAKKLATKMENNVLQREEIEVQRNLLQYKMSRGSQDDQWSEEKIMSLDLTHYTPLQRQY
ncbi:hypothetical protein BAE44_0002391, partial [Dichanthelium oligosanthes]